MPRPRKWRKVCCLPKYNRFGPLDSSECDGLTIMLTIDEYESVRLIDLEGLTQEECALRMDIARTTVQGIYNEARKKLADSLINCKILVIEGGDYRLCDGNGEYCSNRGCSRRRHFENMQYDINQGGNIMKTAIPADDKALSSGVCPSFGRALYFAVYDPDTKETEFIDNPAASSQGGAGIKAAQFIVDNGVQAVITPRCGQNAQLILSKADISLYKSASGTVGQNIEAFISGKLSLLTEIHPGFHGHG